MDMSFDKGVTIKFVNTYNAEKESPVKVFNTGMSSLGDPHIDKDFVDKFLKSEDTGAGKSLVNSEDTKAFAFKVSHDITINIYRTNSFVTIKPGDSLTITTMTAAETAFYESIRGEEFLEIYKNGTKIFPAAAKISGEEGPSSHVVEEGTPDPAGKPSEGEPET